MRKGIFIFTVFMAILLAGIESFCQGWTRIGLLSGENCLCTAVSPRYDNGDNYVIVGTHDGVWYSDNGGNNWVHPTAMWGIQVNDIIIAPNFNGSGVIYAATEDGRIFKSTDGHTSWVLDYTEPSTPSTLPFRALEIAPNYATNGVVFAGAFGSGLYKKTLTGGWQPVSTPSGAAYINALAISPNYSADNVLFVASNHNLQIGSPGTVYLFNGTWVNKNSGLPGTLEDYLSITISPKYATEPVLFLGSTFNGVYKTANGGNTWTAYCLGVFSSSIPSIRLSPTYHTNSQDKNLFIGAADGLYKSQDSSCIKIGPSLVIEDIAVSPQYMNTCTYFVATPFGLYANRGDCLIYGQASPEGGEIDHVAVDSGGSVVFGSDPNTISGGIFKSKISTLDKFVQYNAFENDASGYLTSKVPNIKAIAISPTYDENGTCGSDLKMLLAGTIENGEGHIYQSVSGGSRFRDINFSLVGGSKPKVSYIIFSPNFATDKTIFVGTEGSGVVRGYQNSVFNWSWTTLGTIPDSYILCLGISPNYNNSTGVSGTPSATVFCSAQNSGMTSGNFYYSTNFGNSWTASSLSRIVPSFAVKPTYPTAGGIYAGTNSAYMWYNVAIPPSGTWNQVSSGLPESYITSVISTTARVYAGLKNFGIYYWPYSGSFSSVLTQPSDKRINCLDFDRTNPSKIFVGTKSERLLQTTDGTNFNPTFDYNTLPDDVTGMAVFPYNNDIIIAASPTYGFFISTDRNLFRPWNFGDGSGVCIEGAYSVAVTERYGFPTFLNVFGGAVSKGIVMRYIWNNPPYIDWIDLYDWNSTSQTTGDFERLAFMGQCDPAWACSNTLGPFRNFNPTDPCNSGYYQWNSQGNGLPEYTCEDLRFGQASGFKDNGPFSPTGSISWSTTSNSGVYRTTDGGSLTNLVPTWIEANGAGIGRLSDLQTRSVIQLTNITGVPTTVLCGTLSNGVYRSSDLGSTSWDQSISGIDPGTYSLYAKEFLEASNGDVLVAMQANGYNGGVFLSGDRGRHWDNISAGLPSTIHLADMVNDASVPISYYATSTDGGAWTRTITANPYPTVTGIDVTSGSSAGGTTVNITGTGFDTLPLPVSAAVFGDEDAASTTVNSATSITAVTPAHAPGSVIVGVRNPDTRRGDCSTCIFTFTNAGESDGITLTLSKSTGVQLDWVPSGNVTVRRATNPQMSSGVQDHAVNGGTYTDNTGALADSNTYYYKVW